VSESEAVIRCYRVNLIKKLPV